MNSRYFKSREDAGKTLSDLLSEYRFEDTIVIALSDGGVMIGEPIATHLHCLLTMLLTEDIHIPGEPEPYGSVNQDGYLSYNGYYSVGEREGYYSEFHGFIDQQKHEKFKKLNRILGNGGILNTQMVKDRVVVLVSDGFLNGASLDAAMDFLKPIRTQKIIVATPLATVLAVDKMHVLADELHVLAVDEDLLEVNHYYENNDVPSHEKIIKKINEIILKWH